MQKRVDFKIKNIKNKEFCGPLSKYLENCQEKRLEAIYNTEYKYIKNIIYDEDAQNKFGDTRKGYEKYKNEAFPNIKTDFSYGGQLDLRLVTNRETGELVGAFTETKRTSNDNFEILLKQFEDAKAEVFKILDVNDEVSFNYYLDNYIGTFGFSRSGVNETISSIQRLEEILIEYEEDEEYKIFIDKIKG